MLNETALLYSGGTDSTLAAAIAAEQFDKIHLITYKRFGLFSVTNPLANVKKLQRRLGRDKFTHTIMPIDKLFKSVSYENFMINLAKYGFFLLSTCGICKLSMHVRTLIYCLQNNISSVSDGANQGMLFFPDQMNSVIEETKKMYAKFGINYFNPVFKFEGPQDIEFADRLHFERIPLLKEEKDQAYYEKKKQTTSYKLYELGLMPSEHVKGSSLDRSMQPRCFQFILFNIWLHWYYFAGHTYEEYEKETLKFFTSKIETFTRLTEEYLQKKEKSKLFKLIEY